MCLILTNALLSLVCLRFVCIRCMIRAERASFFFAGCPFTCMWWYSSLFLPFDIKCPLFFYSPNAHQRIIYYIKRTGINKFHTIRTKKSWTISKRWNQRLATTTTKIQQFNNIQSQVEAMWKADFQMKWMVKLRWLISYVVVRGGCLQNWRSLFYCPTKLQIAFLFQPFYLFSCTNCIRILNRIKSKEKRKRGRERPCERRTKKKNGHSVTVNTNNRKCVVKSKMRRVYGAHTFSLSLCILTHFTQK